MHNTPQTVHVLPAKVVILTLLPVKLFASEWIIVAQYLKFPRLHFQHSAIFQGIVKFQRIACVDKAFWQRGGNYLSWVWKLEMSA